MARWVRVTRTALSPHSGLQLPNSLVWRPSTAATVQRMCELPWPSRAAQQCPVTIAAHVTGHSTPAVTDVGCASVRVKLATEMPDGGYLLALQSRGSSFKDEHPFKRVVAGIAAVPGEKGLDRYGKSRRGLAECVLMSRPIVFPGEEDRLTFLHTEALERLFPAGCDVDVHVIARVHEFFLGLKVRMQQISEEAQKFAEREAAQEEKLASHMRAASVESVLRAGGMEAAEEVEPPPPDAAYLFDHCGAGGNTGVSGQRIVMDAEGDSSFGAIPPLALPPDTPET